jgi:alpha-galactosidase
LAGQPEVALLERFPPSHRHEQHIPFIEAIAADRETKLQLNVPNRGAIPGIPDDVLVEIPTLVSGRGIQNVQVDPLPPRLMNNMLLPRMLVMENLHQAFLDGDRKTLVLMVANDPRTRSYEQAKDLVDTLLAQPWNAEADRHYRW